MNVSQGLLVVVAAAGHLMVGAMPSFQANKELPNLGLRVRILGNSTPEPLPQPQVHTYTITRGEEKSQQDRLSVYEMWYASQHAGQWRDAAGNVMIIAQPTVLLPEVRDAIVRSAENHVTREAYKQAAEAPELALGETAGEAALSAWLEAFTGVKPTGVEKLKVSQNLSNALFFAAGDTKTLMWMFRMKGRTSGGKVKPSAWYAVVIRVNDATPVQKVRQDFERLALANAATIAPAGGGSGPKDPGKGNGAASDSRDEIIRTIKNMDGWWYAEAADYIFISNIRGAAGKSLVRELQNTLPTLREAFAKVVEPFSDKREVNVVRIVDSKEAYATYVGEQLEWSVGCWMPSRRELCILSQGEDSRDDKEKTVMIIRHEAFHQYLFYASDGRIDATWYNEGHAGFFEAAELKAQKRVEVKESNKKRTLMENLDAAAQNIPLILDMDHTQFYAGGDQKRSLNYATAWGLVCFLHCGTSTGKAAAYAKVLGNYRQALKTSRDAKAATQEAFEDVDMKALQNAFLDFWRKGGMSKRFWIE